MISSFLSSFAAVEKAESVIKRITGGNAPCQGKHWRKYRRKDKETGGGSPKRTKNRRMPLGGARGMNSPRRRRRRRCRCRCRREGRDARVADTQWRADALDFVASFLRLVRVLSSFLPLISSAFRERETRFPASPYLSPLSFRFFSRARFVPMIKLTLPPSLPPCRSPASRSSRLFPFEADKQTGTR